MNFQGRVALVTGGTKGIGLAVTHKLVEQGATVIVWSRTGQYLREQERVDVRDQIAVTAAVQRIIEAHGKIDILINNAGEFGPMKSALDYSLQEWNEVLLSALTSQFIVSKAVIPHMVNKGYGRVVNMSSVAAKDTNPMAPAYSTAKAGVIAFTKCLGRQLAKTGVTVNCVTPAAAATDLFKGASEENIAVMLKKCPMERFIKVEEIADLVCWIASEECSATTAAVFDISGGRAQF